MISKFLKIYLIHILLIYGLVANGQVKSKPEWWLEEPFRLVQTNLREIDAIDFDIDVYLRSVKKMTDGTEMPWQTKENGWIEVVVPELQSFDIVLVEYK